MFLMKRLYNVIEYNRKVLPDDNSKQVRRIGRQGKGRGQFASPGGIAVNKTGDVIVADTDNHRIQIFGHDGSFKRKFGSKGREPHLLNCPMCVAVTSDDRVVVTDSVNRAVKIFTLTGDYIATYAAEDSLQLPHGVAVAPNNGIVLTDIHSHRVVVLLANGHVSHTFGRHGNNKDSYSLDMPHYVTVNKHSQIIVSDTGNGAVKLFSFCGKILRVFDWNDFRINDGENVIIYDLCADCDGNTILICNNTIYILLKNGRLWELISPTDGLQSPKCLAYSALGHLVVSDTECHCVTTYMYNHEDFSSLNALRFYQIDV